MEAGPETVEHPMERELEPDSEEAALLPPETVVKRAPDARRARRRRDRDEDAPEGDSADGDEDEDVLEETPEFLRDQPEDDELWFEQGEPKDFDF